MRPNDKNMVLALSLLLAATPALAVQPSNVDPLQHGAKSETTNLMVGKKVLGTSREYLGMITAVNGANALLKTPEGQEVPVPVTRLSAEEDHLRVMMSKGDVIALVRQTGQSGVFEVDAKSPPKVK